MADKVRNRKTAAVLVLAFLGNAALSGCAGSIEQWIVDTRIHQGDVALNDSNPDDAVVAYELALRVDPANARAQAGFVEASADEAQVEYTHGHFDTALETISHGLRVDPSSVRLDALKTQIQNAELKQEIVISNYPTYQRAGEELELGYRRLNVANSLLIKRLARFGYTYDVADLTQAIRESLELQLDVERLTTRLIAYRELVQTGGPQPAAAAPATAGSLLPLP